VKSNWPEILPRLTIPTCPGPGGAAGAWRAEGYQPPEADEVLKNWPEILPLYKER
jgi:hypothetical protein